MDKDTSTDIQHLKATVEFYCGCGQSAFYVEGKLGETKRIICKGCKTGWLVRFGDIVPIISGEKV
jgi:hypothetical protein